MKAFIEVNKPTEVLRVFKSWSRIANTNTLIREYGSEYHANKALEYIERACEDMGVKVIDTGIE